MALGSVSHSRTLPFVCAFDAVSGKELQAIADQPLRSAPDLPRR
jgi:hypothetical protein